MNARHPAMQTFLQSGYTQAMRVVDAARTREFQRNTTYDGLALVVTLEQDIDGLHLREVQAAADGSDLSWFPKHICALIKAQVSAEISKEDMS
jgi:hypothetical protein